MSLSKEVQQILERSSTLSECLSNQFQPDATDFRLQDQRLARWQQVTGTAFHICLEWDNLDLDTLRPKLGSVHWQGENPPAWTLTLEKILAIAQCSDPQVDCYQLFVEVARQELSQQIEDCLSLLSITAYQRLEDSLLKRLIILCDPVIPNFSKGEMLLTLFQEYSVLARLVAITIDAWVKQIAQFLQNLAEDLPRLSLLYKRALEQVVEVELRETSGGQRNFIAIVTFACGLKLVYKSSPLGIQTAYEQLLLWFNQSQAFPLKFKTLTILERDRGGWVEYVEHHSCDDQSAVKRYYQRAGMLLCIVYALSGIDCHHANLIACGEYPVLIDTETLLQPRLAAAPNSGELSEAEMQAHHTFVENSVLQTGFLPVWKVLAHHQVSDGSSLAGTSGDKRHRPTLNGKPAVLMEYESDVIEGFQQMYRFLLKQRDVLLSQDSPWMNLTRHPIRFLFRSNRIYEAVLRRSLRVECLRQGIDRSIELNILSRAFLAQADKPPFWKVLAAEIDAIERLEIPHFQVSSNQTNLIHNNTTIVESYFEQSASESAIDRLQHLIGQDLEQQVQWIRGSIYAHSIEPSFESKKIPNHNKLARSLIPDQAVDWAIQIAQKLQNQAIYGSDGSVTWVGLAALPEVQKFQLQPIDDSLFQGSCGIALFFAALAKLTHDSTWEELAISTIQPLCQRLRFTVEHPNNSWICRITATDTTELGGYLYSLTRLSQFLDRPDLLESAILAASHINPNLSRFGLLNGIAGMILGLLSLYEVTLTPSLLTQACECGERLLTEKHMWMKHSGFAYGNTGIAYALLRLFSMSGNLRFLQQAQTVLSVIALTEFDRLDWAQGTTGIGLGCIGSLSITDTSHLRCIVDSTLLRLKASECWRGVDHLYAGNFGQLELLLSAAETLAQPALYQFAQDRAAELIDRATHRNDFYLCDRRSPDILHPGFFQGVTGIGYMLLRLTNPKEIPSVLLWK